MYMLTSGLGVTQQTGQAIGGGIGAGLKIAALVDPEPVSKAILSIAALLGPLLGGLFGTSVEGQQKIATTQIVNDIEPLLKQNVAAYLDNPTVANQQAALSNFDSTWASMVQSCGQAQFAQAGQNCILDRQRGGRWDWFSYYRDPISQSVPIDAGRNVAIAGAVVPSSMLLAGGLILAAVLL
jgi:hypothetical protein